MQSSGHLLPSVGLRVSVYLGLASQPGFLVFGFLPPCILCRQLVS